MCDLIGIYTLHLTGSFWDFYLLYFLYFWKCYVDGENIGLIAKYCFGWLIATQLNLADHNTYFTVQEYAYLTFD